MVVLHHTSRLLLQKYDIDSVFFHPFNNEYARVDLFFILSGFIIYYIHYKDIHVFSKLKPFLTKRFVRIYPVYWIVTVIFMLFTVITHKTYSISTIVSSFLLLPDSQHPILGVAWTLVYEIFLYLMFGLLIMNRKLFGPVVGVWIAAMLGFFVGGVSFKSHPYLDVIFNPLNLEFVAGCVICAVVVRVRMNFVLIGTFGVLLLLTSFLLQEFKVLDLHHVYMWGVPYVFIMAGLTGYELRQDLRPSRFLIKLGDASYSIYLTHVIVLLSFQKMNDKLDLYGRFGQPVLMATGVFVIAILFGYLFYHGVEKPVLNFMNQRVFRLRPKQSAAAAGSSAMIGK